MELNEGYYTIRSIIIRGNVEDVRKWLLNNDNKSEITHALRYAISDPRSSEEIIQLLEPISEILPYL